MFFSRFDWEDKFGEEDQRGKRPFSSHHIKGTYTCHESSPQDVNLEHLAAFAWCLPYILTRLFAHGTLCKEITLYGAHVRSGERDALIP